MKKAMILGATAAVAWAMMAVPAQAAEQTSSPTTQVAPAKHAGLVKHTKKHKKHKKHKKSI